MLSVQEHPIVQSIDDEIAEREKCLVELQLKRVRLTKILLKCKFDYAVIICKNLNIELKSNRVAILCGYEFLTNQQMVEQWLLEQLAALNQCQFNCSILDLQDKLLMKLNALQQDLNYY